MLSRSDVEVLVSGLVTDELVVVPVRHHSPACAWQVRRAVADLSPSVVLVEGPRTFTPLVPFLTHDQARMPLAVYSYATRAGDVAREGRQAAFYPFCDYSPELVALREASGRGVPVRFIDLTLAEQIVADRTGDDDPEGDRSLLAEHRYRHSAGLGRLAETLGCRDHEDLWELLVEVDGAEVDLREHVSRLSAYCLLARQDAGDEDLVLDGTSAREAEMTAHVAEALAARRPGDGPVLVVVGGFHAVALPELLADPPPRPTIDTAGYSEGAALTRYTFERLERLNGYASGMTAPAWHQRLWELMTDRAAVADATDEPAARAEPRERAALLTLADVADRLRTRHAMPLALPTVAAAYEQARRLADLRDRGSPLRTDLLDAVLSCFVKGDVDVEGALVTGVTDRVLTGEAVGVLPPGTGTPPLVADVIARLRRQRLDVDGIEQRTAALDIYRRPDHRATGRLLHGLALLDVPFATRVSGPDFVHRVALDRVQERWQYLWTPVTEGALVEAALYGSTLPDAIAARFADRLAELRDGTDGRSAAAATGALVSACLVGLHDRVTDTLALAREAIAVDPAFDGVAAAATQLGLLWEAREPLEARRLADLPTVLDAAYRRAIYLARDLQGSQCEPLAAVEALTRLRELVIGDAGRHIDAELYWDVLDRLGRRHDVALVRGGAIGLSYSGGRTDGPALARAVDGHLGGTSSPGDAVGFVRGLLLTAREAAWQEPGLLTALDHRLGQWAPGVFIAHLPELRLAFASLTPRETDRVAGAVAALHGISRLGPLRDRDRDEASVQRNLTLSDRVATLLEGDGLATWGGRT